MSQLEAEQGQVSFEEEYKKLGNNADATIKSMTDWAQGLVRKGVWSEADFEEFKIMGGTAQGIRALQKVRSYYGDKPIPVDVGPIDGAPSKEELMAMVGKPEYNSDPAYRAKVEKMFEQVYGSQRIFGNLTKVRQLFTTVVFFYKITLDRQSAFDLFKNAWGRSAYAQAAARKDTC
jgi:hypothetical protein